MDANALELRIILLQQESTKMISAGRGRNVTTRRPYNKAPSMSTPTHRLDLQLNTTDQGRRAMQYIEGLDKFEVLDRSTERNATTHDQHLRRPHNAVEFDDFLSSNSLHRPYHSVPKHRNEQGKFLHNASLDGRRLSMSNSTTVPRRQAPKSVPNPRNEDGNISRNASLNGGRNNIEYNEIQDFKSNPDGPPQSKPLIEEISSRRFGEDHNDHAPTPQESNDNRILGGPPRGDFVGIDYVDSRGQARTAYQPVAPSQAGSSEWDYYDYFDEEEFVLRDRRMKPRMDHLRAKHDYFGEDEVVLDGRNDDQQEDLFCMESRMDNLRAKQANQNRRTSIDFSVGNASAHGTRSIPYVRRGVFKDSRGPLKHTSTGRNDSGGEQFICEDCGRGPLPNDLASSCASCANLVCPHCFYTEWNVCESCYNKNGPPINDSGDYNYRQQDRQRFGNDRQRQQRFGSRQQLQQPLPRSRYGADPQPSFDRNGNIQPSDRMLKLERKIVNGSDNGSVITMGPNYKWNVKLGSPTHITLENDPLNSGLEEVVAYIKLQQNTKLCNIVSFDFVEGDDYVVFVHALMEGFKVTHNLPLKELIAYVLDEAERYDSDSEQHNAFMDNHAWDLLDSCNFRELWLNDTDVLKYIGTVNDLDSMLVQHTFGGSDDAPLGCAANIPDFDHRLGNLSPHGTSLVSRLGFVRKTTRVLFELIDALTINYSEHLVDLRHRIDFMKLENKYTTYTDFLRDAKKKFDFLKLVYQLIARPWEEMSKKWMQAIIHAFTHKPKKPHPRLNIMSTAFQFFISNFSGTGVHRDLDTFDKYTAMVDSVRDVERKDNLGSTRTTKVTTTTAPSGGAVPTNSTAPPLPRNAGGVQGDTKPPYQFTEDTLCSACQHRLFKRENSNYLCLKQYAATRGPPCPLRLHFAAHPEQGANGRTVPKAVCYICCRNGHSSKNCPNDESAVEAKKQEAFEWAEVWAQQMQQKHPGVKPMTVQEAQAIFDAKRKKKKSLPRHGAPPLPSSCGAVPEEDASPVVPSAPVLPVTPALPAAMPANGLDSFGKAQEAGETLGYFHSKTGGVVSRWVKDP